MLETVIVLGIIVVIAAMAIPQVTAAMKSSHDESAFQLVARSVREARMRAIETRRIVRVSFAASPARITAVPLKADGADDPDVSRRRSVLLEAPNDFVVVSGMPVGANKVPDGFGAGTLAIDLLSGTGEIYFYPDGSAHTNTGAPNGGVVYVARPGVLSSARAISILSGTGRVAAWRVVKKGTESEWRHD